MATVSRTEAKNTQTTTRDQYINMQRNQFYMPDWGKNKHLLSGRWMYGCRNGTYWLPRCHQINNSQCVEPPPKEVIYAELQELLSERGRTMGLKNHNQLEAKYMMTMIATMEPNHQWFSKGWIYWPVVRPRKVEKEAFDNLDDYFTGLPESKNPKKRGRAKHGDN